jgi:hypothetical protein
MKIKINKLLMHLKEKSGYYFKSQELFPLIGPVHLYSLSAFTLALALKVTSPVVS